MARIDDQTARALCAAALEARRGAYCPYSGFAVGAALLTADGAVFTGVNIENASFTPTNCAERTAFFAAIAAGHRAFRAIAVAGGRAGEEPAGFCAPCGVCRQVMREFCADDFEILLAKPGGVKRCTLGALLPESFSPADLEDRDAHA